MDLLLIAIFSLAVFYHGVSSRQSPKRVGQHAGEAADDARQEDIEVGVARIPPDTWLLFPGGLGAL